MATYIVNPTEDQEKAVKAFLEALEVVFVKEDDSELPAHVLQGIERGKEDVKAGRFTTFEDIKRKYPQSLGSSRVTTIARHLAAVTRPEA